MEEENLLDNLKKHHMEEEDFVLGNFKRHHIPLAKLIICKSKSQMNFQYASDHYIRYGRIYDEECDGIKDKINWEKEGF